MTAQRKRRGRAPVTILRELRRSISYLAAVANWPDKEAWAVRLVAELRAALKKGAKTCPTK